MKQLYLLIFIFILAIPVCWGQKVYKLTEGKAVFINPDSGIVIKKENKYYSFKIYNDIIKSETIFRKEFDEISPLKFSELSKNPNTIYLNQIVPYDFKGLINKKFILSKGQTDYEFFQFNNEYFTLFSKTKKNVYPAYPVNLNEYFLYYILDLGNDQKIIASYSNYGIRNFLVPIKDKIKIIIPFTDEDYKRIEYFDYQKLSTEEIKVNARQLHAFYDRAGFDDEIYRIDTLKNKKVRVINYLNQPVFKKEYDSIKIDKFMICYKRGIIDLYNPTLKNFALKNVKAIIPNQYDYTAQILKGNDLGKIDISGNEDNIESFNVFMVNDNLNSGRLTNIFVVKQNEQFYVYTDESVVMAEQFVDANQKIALKDNLGIQAVYFHTNSDTEKFDSTMGMLQNGLYVYCKMKDGNYNIYDLNALFRLEKSANQSYYSVQHLPFDLEAVEGMENNKMLFKIKKNNLFGYFPLNKEPKYKTLEKFQENFARFELPNGQKGWIDLTGREYLDN